MTSSASQREYPEDLPPPYLFYHNGTQVPSCGRAPTQGSENVQLDGEFVIPRMPTAEELAVLPIPEGFRCPLCLDVLDQPTITVPCGHTFCERCILQSLEESSEEGLSPTSSTPCTRCPVCRSVIRKDRLGPCWIVRDLIDNIGVRCDYGVSYNVHSRSYEQGEPAGCKASFRLADRSLHLQECGYVMVSCKYAKDRCPAMPTRAQIRGHEQDCIYRSEDCKCGQRIRTQLWGEHQEACPSVEVCCPHQRHGCSNICMRGDLEEHLATCPYENLKDLLEEKDRQVQELQMKNLQLESSLWTALKSKQQLEQEIAELRLQAGVESGTPTSQGDEREERGNLTRSASSSPQRGTIVKHGGAPTDGVILSSDRSLLTMDRSATIMGGSIPSIGWVSPTAGGQVDQIVSSVRQSLQLDGSSSHFRGSGQKGHLQENGWQITGLSLVEGGAAPQVHAPPEREKGLKPAGSNPRYRAVQVTQPSSQWRPPHLTEAQMHDLKSMPAQQSI